MKNLLTFFLLLVALPAAAQPARPVTSVGLSMPSIFSVTNSPVTSSGTLTATLRNEVAAMIFAGPTIGSPAAPPSFRPFGLGDLPASLGYVQSFGARCDGTHDDSSAFQLADAAGAGTIMVPPGTCVIGAAAGAAQALIHQLVMPPGAKLSISSGVALTLAVAPMASPQQQIFALNGTGKVAITAAGPTVYPEWWGAKADGTAPTPTNNGPPVQAAANALILGGTIFFGPGFYNYDCSAGNAVVITTSLVNLIGSGSQLTFQQPTTNCAHFLFQINPAGQSGYVRDMGFRGASLFGRQGAPYPLPSALHTWGAMLCSHCGQNDFSHLQLFGGAYFLKGDSVINVSFHELELQGCAIACITLGNGPLDQTGAQNVALTDLDFVRALGLPSAFTGTILATTLTVTGMSSGVLGAGLPIAGPGFSTTIVAQTSIAGGSAPGGNGTYTISTPQSVTSPTAMQSPSVGTGLVIDSGATEISVRRFLQGAQDGGVLIQNSAAGTGAHRPEGIRFYDGVNLSNNASFAMNVQSAWTVENYGTSFNGTSAGPGVILGPAGAVFTGSITGTSLAVSAVTSGTIQVGQNVVCTGCAPGTAIVGGGGSSWTVSVAQPVPVPAGTAIASAAPTVDRFTMIGGESIGNAQDGVLIQSACNVAIRSALLIAAGPTYAGVHATPMACGNLEVTGNTAGDVEYGNIANLQAWGIRLDGNSFTTQTMSGFSRVGRVNIQTNMLAGNQTGSIDDRSVPTGPSKMIQGNLQ